MSAPTARELLAENERLRMEFRRIEECAAAMLAGERCYAQVMKMLHEAPRLAPAQPETSLHAELSRISAEGGSEMDRGWDAPAQPEEQHEKHPTGDYCVYCRAQWPCEKEQP